MSIKDKMKKAKESHLFDELSEKEKFEAILEGKLKVRLIAELERERDKLLPKYRGGEADEYNKGANDMLEEIIEHIDNRILELKGE